MTYIKRRRAQRAAASGRILSADDAAIVKGMLARGDNLRAIAIFFRVNVGCVKEIAAGRKFAGVSGADPGKLPQPEYPAAAPNKTQVLTLDRRLRDLLRRVERIERQVNRPAPLTMQ
jgi:hypothetical protein